MNKISIVLFAFIILFISCREEQSQQNELETKEIAIKSYYK